MIKGNTSSPSSSSSSSPTRTTQSTSTSAPAAPSTLSNSANSEGGRRSPTQDNRDQREAARPSAIPRPSISPTQAHFAALSLGAGGQGAAMRLRGGAGPKKAPLTKEERDARAAAHRAVNAALSPEQHAQAKADRARAAAEKKEAASQKPLNGEQSAAAHAEGARMYADVQDRAYRALESLPKHMPMVVADEKIHKYAFNSTHKDAASKAGGFEALGHPVKPGGTEYPMMREMYDHGEALKRQIITSASNRTAEVEDRPGDEIAKRGVKFGVVFPLKGIGAKSDKEIPLQTVWIDKRKDTESSNGVLELVTLIPKGDKK